MPALPGSNLFLIYSGRRQLPANQSISVEDQDDAAIAQFGCAGDAASLYQRIVDGAHDDFALTDNAIYSDACGARTAADDESVKSPRRTSVKCSSHSAK